MKKKLKDNLLPLSLMLLIPIINIPYVFLNNSSRGVHSLVTSIDTSVPFIKVFAVPYLIWYPFIVASLMYFCFYHRKTYYKVLSSMLAGMVTCFIFYYFFQTSVPRPDVTGNDVFSFLVRFVYDSDGQYNCFPSLHVLTSYLMIIGMRHANKKITKPGICIITTALLIILSTQFIKQHVIMDLIFAIMLSDGIYKIVDSFGLERSLLCIQKLSWLLMMRKKSET